METDIAGINEEKMENQMEQYYQSISFEEAKTIMDKETECMIIDVREEEEFITGHADGAVLFPVDSINEHSAKEMIPTMDTPVLVYCRSGKRSEMASLRLSELGYTRIYNIGSLVGWPYGIVC
jgi:rhodanese-related sulfurtransferase